MEKTPESNATTRNNRWWALAPWSSGATRCCWCAGARSRPGGLVELGETLAAAIQRELAEETGLTVTLLGISAVVERIFPDPDGRIAYHYVLVDYLCDYLGGN